MAVESTISLSSTTYPIPLPTPPKQLSPMSPRLLLTMTTMATINNVVLHKIQAMSSIQMFLMPPAAIIEREKHAQRSLDSVDLSGMAIAWCQGSRYQLMKGLIMMPRFLECEIASNTVNAAWFYIAGPTDSRLYLCGVNVEILLTTSAAGIGVMRRSHTTSR